MHVKHSLKIQKDLKKDKDKEKIMDDNKGKSIVFGSEVYKVIMKRTKDWL